MDSRDIAQLEIERCVEAHKPRDDTTFSGQYLSCSAATGRLVVVKKRVDRVKSLKSSDNGQTETSWL